MPQKDLGWRIDPPVSVPVAPRAILAATAGKVAGKVALRSVVRWGEAQFIAAAGTGPFREKLQARLHLCKVSCLTGKDAVSLAPPQMTTAEADGAEEDNRRYALSSYPA